MSKDSNIVFIIFGRHPFHPNEEIVISVVSEEYKAQSFIKECANPEHHRYSPYYVE